VWVAAAGGGHLAHEEGLDPQPVWHAVTAGLPTNALGSLVVDPTDASGNTLYAGTGEANAINQAGLGVYKSTDGGDSWRSCRAPSTWPRIARSAPSRSIPDPKTIWIGTALGLQGQSSVNGGDGGAARRPALGVYRSTDGGQHFSLQFSQRGAAGAPNKAE
jgi:hypothetical protein